jgi:integrase
MTIEASQAGAKRAQPRPDTWIPAPRGSGIAYQPRARGRKSWGYWSPSHNRYLRAGSTRAEAKAAQSEERSKKARGQRVVVPPKKTVAELAAEWLDGKIRLAPWTRRGYEDGLRLVLLPYFDGWQATAVDAESIAKLIRGLEVEGLHFVDPKRPVRPLGASAITTYVLKPLGGMFSLALRRDYVQENPVRLLTADDRPRQQDAEAPHEWSDEEIAKLLAESAALAKRRGARQNYEPLLRTALYTGLRLGELLGLQWGDIDLDQGVLHVKRQWTLTRELTAPKTKAGIRRVPLSAEMVAVLRRRKLASKFSQDTDFVFASQQGTPLTHRNVQTRGFEAARDLAGLPSSLTFHSMRHGFASLCAVRGIPIQVLSAALGHRDIGVTQKVYVHLYDRQSAEDSFRAAMNGGAS